MTEIYIRTDEAGRITAKDEFGLVDEIKRRYLGILYGSGNLGAMMPDDDCDCGGPVL